MTVLELGQRLGSEADALARLRATQLSAPSQKQMASKRPVTPASHSILEAVVQVSLSSEHYQWNLLPALSSTMLSTNRRIFSQNGTNASRFALQERSVPNYSIEALLDSEAIDAAMDSAFPAVSPAKAAAMARTVEGYRAPAPRVPRTAASQRHLPPKSILKKPAIIVPPVVSSEHFTPSVRDESAAVRDTVTERVPVSGSTRAVQETVQWRSGAEDVTTEATNLSGSSQPVLVLEMDGDESHEEGELRFARLQA